jgi:heme exporter protein B
LALVGRDLQIARRDGGALGTALGFFVLVVATMPLGLGPNLELLGRIAPGVLWIALLLAALLSLGRMFESDHEDGTLEALHLGSLPLELVILAKALTHWLTTCLPLTLITPIVGVLLNLDLAVMPALIATLLAGTPAVSLIGAIGAALTLGARRSGLLLAVLILPLYVPTLVFGIATISAVVTPPGSFWSPFAILVAISLTSLVIAPIAAAAALRVQTQ